MPDIKKKSKKRNYKPLFILAIFLTAFGGFIYLLLKPSTESIAIDELQTASTTEDVRSLWEKNKVTLADDGDYLKAVKDKLSTFDLSESQTTACLNWLPKPQQSLNIIIVPDLSGRINDSLNNPSQITNDTSLMNEIWNSFEYASRLKMNSHDRLIVDVTGGNQAQGQFRSIADNLIFDLSDFKDKSDKLYFEKVGNQFQTNVAKLYEMARKNPQGADYWSYFNHDLKRNLKTSTLYTAYRNILIILTDGYLEAQTKQATGIAFYTGTYQQRSGVFDKLKAGISVADAVSSITPIMDCSDHFPTLEVEVLEANARHTTSPQEPYDPGTPRDLDILSKLWKDWFAKLEIKNAAGDCFTERVDATDLTKKKIENFIIGPQNN